MESIEAALMACKEVVLKVNLNDERNKCSIMFLSRKHKAGQNYSLKIGLYFLKT